MNREEREARATTVSTFRYSLIAELANPYLKREELRALVRQKAGREHEVPFLGKRTLTESCLRKWLTAYKARGMEGLKPNSRRDVGNCRALTPQVTYTGFGGHGNIGVTERKGKDEGTTKIQR